MPSHINVKLDAYALIRYVRLMSDRLSESMVTAWARLARASQGVLAAVEADLKASGQPPLAWYDALLELKRASEKGLRPGELQAHMLFPQYKLSRLLDRLEQAGYVARRPCPEDGRGQIVTITSEGRRLLPRMWRVYQSAIRTHFADKLTATEAKSLGALLGKIMRR